MGQAKARGTYEERVRLAEIRIANEYNARVERERLARIEREARLEARRQERERLALDAPPDSDRAPVPQPYRRRSAGIGARASTLLAIAALAGMGSRF